MIHGRLLFQQGARRRRRRRRGRGDSSGSKSGTFEKGELQSKKSRTEKRQALSEEHGLKFLLGERRVEQASHQSCEQCSSHTSLRL